MTTLPGTQPASARLHVHEFAAGHEGGPTLVLLHGFPVDHRMFTQMAQHITPGTRVLGVDLPGLGQSRKILPQEPSMEASADLVMASIGEVSGPLVVAGLSMGGYVALALAARFSQRLDGLILLDTRTNADAPLARENRLKVAQRALDEGSSEVVAAMATSTLAPVTVQERPDVVEFMSTLIEEQTGAGVAWSQRAMAARVDRAHAVAEFTHEVLVIVGEADGISSPEVMAQIAHLAPHGRLEIIAGAGHMAPVEQPASVAHHINEYLARLAH